jgi:hypothetical protein
MTEENSNNTQETSKRKEPEDGFSNGSEPSSKNFKPNDLEKVFIKQN